MAEDKMFFVGQKAFIEKDGSVLVLNDPVAGLDFPGGKIQIGETDFTLALKREVREETSLEIVVGDAFATWFLEFAPPHRNAGKQVYLVGFKSKYLSGEVKLSDEHNLFRWVTKDNYREVDDGSAYFKILEKCFAKS
jgi:8-oxo-dGTP pyrophosphatase MutT (NUDIX family)